MSDNGTKIELPTSIVIRDLAQKIEKSPIDLIKKLMTNGVMATINQAVDFDTAAIVVAEYGFEAMPEVVEEQKKEESGEVPLWRQMITANGLEHDGKIADALRNCELALGVDPLNLELHHKRHALMKRTPVAGR